VKISIAIPIEATALREKLAGFINELSGTKFSQQNVWAANGSNEIIQSLYLAFGSGRAVGFTPSYSMHPLIAQVVGVQLGSWSTEPKISLLTCLQHLPKFRMAHH
jgi:histidinol-phosphate aminotransferase